MKNIYSKAGKHLILLTYLLLFSNISSVAFKLNKNSKKINKTKKIFLKNIFNPQISVSTDELIFDGVRNTVIGPKSFTVENTGIQDLIITSFQFSGTNPGKFNTTATPQTLTPGQILVIDVNFVPGSRLGDISAVLNINTNDPVVPQAQVGLYGLSTRGLGGSNEPPLQDVVLTLGYNIDVGWTNLGGGTESTLKGEEVKVHLFEKAGTGDVTIIPVARYSPIESGPFGYYVYDNSGSSIIQTEVGVLLENNASGASDHQMLFPTQATGTTTFDPGTDSFGVYVHSTSFNPERTSYTEESQNITIAHRARVYPLKNRQGQLVPNSYLIGFEEASNGDYQDYLFVLSNVKEAGLTPLPVRLSFFDAKRINEKEVKISWETLNESNNKGFEIQLSKNNQDFETVLFKDGAGNSSSSRKYEVILENERAAYYRIKQIDIDGNYTNSQVKYVASLKKKSELDIYPNPVKNRIELNFETLLKTEEVLLQLYNLQGIELLVIRDNPDNINKTLNLRLQSLPSGQYLLKIYTQSESFTKRFIKY